MELVSLVVLVYLVVGLGVAARVYDGMNGGWDDLADDPDSEVRLSIEMLHRMRTGPNRFAFASMVAVLLLGVVLLWPGFVAWLGWPGWPRRS